MKRCIAATSLSLILGAGTAQAQMVTSQDPQSVLDFFQAEGYPSSLEKDAGGDPLVQVKLFGTSFSVYFYGCQQNKDCTSLQFFSGYRMDGAFKVEQANEWNRSKRFATAYVTESGSARIEYDVMMGPTGIDSEVFEDAVSVWIKGLADFEELIDW